MDLGRFNVLIGEQATGKSTVAKVLAMCRYFSYINSDITNEHPFEGGLISWGLSDARKGDTHIFYDCQHYSLTVDNQMFTVYGYDQVAEKHIDDEIPFLTPNIKPKSKEFENLLAELKKIRPTDFEYLSSIGNWTIPTSFFQNDVARVLDNPFYLPTERGLQSVFSLGKSSIENISDSLFNQLAGLDRIARLFKSDTFIEPLNIVYKNEQGRGYVRKNSEAGFFSMFNAASGYQSTIPAVLVTKYYNEIRKKKKTFIVEEPELNLFPGAQQKLMQYLVDTIINYDNNILLTTHSPYTLTSLNNMMYAYQMGKKNSNQTESIIKKKYWINPDDVSAYMLLPDGGCEDIFDREEGLIKAEKIDKVSGVLNEQFNELLNIEFNKK